MKNAKTTNILLIIIIVILLAPGLLLGLVYVSNELSMRSYYRNTIPAASSPAQSQTTGDAQLDGELGLVSRAKDIAVYHMPGFDVGWTYNPETRIASYNAIRSDYAGYYVENAQSSPEAYLDEWNNSVARATAAQKSLQSYFAKQDVDDITVIVNILDFDDRETPYLTVANGIVGFDAVNGIDLRGDG